MARYIDADELLKDLEGVTNDVNCPLHIAAEIDQTISLFPTADVVEVVRCENCTHSKSYPMRIICHRFGRDVNENGFCSYGERRK